MIATVDRKAFVAAVADIWQFRDSVREQDFPTYVRISASKSAGFFIDAIHLIDGTCYRRELRARIGTDETPADEIGVVYVALASLVKLPLKGDQLYLTFTHNHLIMQSGDQLLTFDHRVLHTSLVWTIPDASDYELVDVFNANRLAAMLKYCLVSAAKDETRPILMAIKLTFTANGLSAERRAVAADGFRLHMATENVLGAEKSQNQYKLLLPAAKIAKLLKAIQNANNVFIWRRVINADTGDVIIRLVFGYHDVFLGEVKGIFPQVTHLYHEHAPLHMTLERADAARTISGLVKWSKPNNHTATFKGQEIIVKNGAGTLTQHIDWEVKETDTGAIVAMPEIGLNTVYFKEALSHMPLGKDGLVLIRMEREGNQPVSISGGYDEVGYTAVIMPISSK